MRKTIEKKEKIESKYVGEDCVQVMFPYYDTLTLIGQEGIVFHYKPESTVYVNRYLYDSRAKQFPYSDTPTDYYEPNQSKRVSYTNQILDFDKPYLRIGDDSLSEFFAVKDNDQALIYSKSMTANSYNERHMTHKELQEFVKNNNPEEQVYYVSLSGGLINKKKLFLSEEEIYNYIRTQISEDTKSLEEINFNIPINDFLLVIRINNKDISIEGIKATFIKENDYKVKVYDILITKHNLEEIKNAPDICISKTEKIPMSLDSDINKNKFEEVRQKIKALSNNKR